MPNQYKNKVIYGNTVLIDITDTTATAADVAAGKYFYAASGEKQVGEATQGGMTIIETPDPNGGTVVTITGEAVRLQAKTITPTESQQIITADAGTDTLITSFDVTSSTRSKTVNVDLSSFNVGDICSITGEVVLLDGMSYEIVNTNVSIDKTFTWTGETYIYSVPFTDQSGNWSISISASQFVISAGYYQSTDGIKQLVDTSGDYLTKIFKVVQGYSGLSQVTVNAIPSQYIVPTGNKAITANGTGIDVAQYATVSVAVPASSPNLQAKTGIVPTEFSQTIEADSGYDGLSSVQINAISSTYVGSGVARKSSSDLSVSGATVTVPAGYYETNATKSVSSMTLPTSTSSSATSGYTSKATISRSTSDQYINIPTGYNSDGAYYKISAVPNGSATAPASITGSSASVSTGTNTLTLTKTVSVTPTVSAGYVSSGTASNTSVSLTASVTTKGAATITPTTSNQTIASGTYLTGTQTIAGDANLVSGNIISGKSIFGVNGGVVIQHYYTGTGTPSSSLGVNGDIYLQTS